MAIQFPDGAGDGDTVDPGNGITYTYNQSKDKWTGAVSGSGGGGNSSIIVSEVTPGDASDGDMWFKPSTGKLHVYVTDAWTVTGVPMDIWTDIPTA